MSNSYKIWPKSHLYYEKSFLASLTEMAISSESCRQCLSVLFGTSPWLACGLPWLTGAACFFCIPACPTYRTLHWHMQELNEYFYPAFVYSCLGKLFISYPVTSKILARIYSTLSLMRLTFNNCSAHQVQWFPFHFLEPPAISLREIFLFLFILFNLLYFR